MLYLPVQRQVVKARAVHCHCNVCSAAGGHSAGCRMYWVCLQHHATVVTSNGVTIFGSKFPPTVSKHCQHQHSTIPKTIPAIWNTNTPSCCFIEGAASSVQHHGSLVHSHSNLFSDVSPGLPTYNKYNEQNLQWCSVRSFDMKWYIC
jgi:hypothetical protein